MAKETAAGRARALTANDWVEAAARAMAEGGVGGVAVEPIAQRLGVTKGSFYWHFADRPALLAAVLKRWEEGTTEAVGAALAPVRDPGERLARLVEDALADEPWGDRATDAAAVSRRGFALAVSDAAEDPIVGPVARRVSARRIAALEECFRGLGFAGDEARSRALLAYAATVGTLRLAREAPDWAPRGEELRAYRRHLIAALASNDGRTEGGNR